MQIYPQIHRDWPSPSIELSWRSGHELLAGSAWVELPVGVITVTGERRLEWLNSLGTQDVRKLAPGLSTETLILNPSGHIELSLFLFDDGEKLWILTEEAPAAVEYLQALRFREKLQITQCGTDFVAIGYFSPLVTTEQRGADSLGEHLEQSSCLVWTDPWPQRGDNTTVYTPAGLEHPAAKAASGERKIAVLSRPSVAEITRFPQADLGAWEAERISRWRPRLGREGKPGTLPHELDWLRTAVTLDKGCYPGQETVAKLVNRGRPRCLDY